jgi:hypothetical protein
MRHFNRSATQQGCEVLEHSIKAELDRRFPPAQFRLNIDVVGSTVQFTNFEEGIKIFERVTLKWDAHEDTILLRSILAMADRVIGNLMESGKLPHPLE